MSGKRAKKDCAVILTAHQTEYQAVRAHLESIHEEVHERGTIYERGDFQAESRVWDVGLAQIGTGNAVTASEVERAVTHFAPKVLFFVGIAGGLKDVQVGDVVVATKVYGYESGKAEASSFCTRPDVGLSSYSLIQRASAEARKQDWLRRIQGREHERYDKLQVLIGPIATGEKVVSSTKSAIFTFLHKNYNDALAVEMQGRGFLEGVYRNDQVQALVVLGTSNLLDDKSEQEALGSKAVAAQHASAFTFEILAKLDGIGSLRPITSSRSSRPEAVMKRSSPTTQHTRRSIFTSIKWFPPPTHPATVQQRESLVQEVYAKLLQKDVTALVLTGIAGVGKSTLAALVYHYTETQRRAGNGSFIDEALWLRCDLGTTMIDLAGTLFDALGKSLPDIQHHNPQELVVPLLSALNATDKSRLIVMDQFENLIDPQTGYALTDRPGIDVWLDALNSQSCTCKVLLTSRLGLRGSHTYPQAYMQKLLIDGLELAEGKALLRTLGVRATEAELHTAVELCQGHPYALVLLASLLGNRNLSLTTFFKEPVYAQLWTGDIAMNILNYIYQHQLNPVQRSLLLAFAVYREPVPSNAALALVQPAKKISEIQVEQTLDVLLSQRLLVAQEGRYQPHAIVAAYAKNHFVEEDQQANAEAVRTAHAQAARYYQQQATMHGFPRELRHGTGDVHELIEAAWHWCKSEQQQTAYQLLQRESIFSDLQRWGGTTLLLQLYQLLLPGEKWHPEPSQEGHIYNELGEIYSVLGKKDIAQRYFEQALSIFHEIGERRGEAVVLSNLGQIHRLLGNKERALECYRQALRVYEEVEDSSGKGIALNNVGKALYDLGQREQAREYYEQALLIHRQEETFDEEAWTLNNLGEVYHDLKQNNTALTSYKQALALFQELENRRGEGITSNNLGVLLRDLGNMEEAQESYGRALHIFRDIGDRWGEGAVLRNVGRLYLIQQRYDRCLACFLVAQEAFQAIGQPDQGEIPGWLQVSLRKQLGASQFERLLAEIKLLAHQLIEQIP